MKIYTAINYMTSRLLDTHLDSVEESLDEKDFAEAKISLDVVKLMLKRNDNAQLALRYSKLYRRYEAELKAELTQVDGKEHNAGDPTTVDKKIQTDITMQKGLDRLIEARRQLLESEEVAASTLTDLKEQRDKLEKIKTNLKDTNEGLSTSNKYLNRMMSWWRS